MGLREEQIQLEGNSLLLDLKMEDAMTCPLADENAGLRASEEMIAANKHVSLEESELQMRT